MFSSIALSIILSTNAFAEIGGGQSAGLRQVKIVNADTEATIGMVYITGSNVPTNSVWESMQEYWYTNELWPAPGEWPSEVEFVIMYDCYNLDWYQCADLPGLPGSNYTLVSQRDNEAADQTPDPAPDAVDLANDLIDECIANASTGDPEDCSAYYFENGYGKIMSMVYTEDDEDLFSVWMQNNSAGQLFNSSTIAGDSRSFFQWNNEEAPSTSGIDNYYWEDPSP